MGPTCWYVSLVACLSFGGLTGYAINPARDLGPRLSHAVLPIAGKDNSDGGYSWIPVVGLLFGSAIAFMMGKTFGLLYLLIGEDAPC